METFIREAFLLVFLISGLPMIAGGAAGVIVSLIQAVTQVSEQSLGFIVKLVTIAALFTLSRDWICAELLSFAEHSFTALALLGKMP